MSEPSLTRRGLLGRGGAAAGAALGGGLLGGAIAASAASAQQDGPTEDKPNALLIVANGIRSDSVGAFDGAFDDNEVARTPNLDDFAGDALRFERAVPEAMPAVISRRALVTGKRSFPYREWQRHAGYAPVPGWNPVYRRQPLIEESLRRSDIETVWITDNPFFSGPRYDDWVQRTTEVRAADYPAPPVVEGTLGREETRRQVERYLLGGIERGTEAMERAVRAGERQLARLERGGNQFFLAVDAFDPAEAYYVPPAWTRELELDPSLAAPLNRRDWIVPADIDDATVRIAREAYMEGVERVDAAVGRLLRRVDDLGLRDNTAVWFVSDGGTMLGEHGWIGRGAPGTYKHAYFVPFLLRDPKGRRSGHFSYYYASTHDVAPTLLSVMGADIPGRMDGENLEALLDEEDPPKRSAFMCASVTRVAVGDPRWLMVMDMLGDERTLHDFDNEHSDMEDDERENVVRKHPPVLAELERVPLAAAGGTFPIFDDESAVRPLPEDDDADDDGIEDRDERNDDAAGETRDLDNADAEFDEGAEDAAEGRVEEHDDPRPPPPTSPNADALSGN
ncbi:MAG: sulfatase-like hydrolase/transferase [Solirubrobacterales bacterium]|nr:sulfatase-like hydrolase/transferase [Solirubrobacterales bacterium]